MRITRRSDGMLVVERHEPGRGAWLCRGSIPCFEMAVRRRAWGRALRAEITPGVIEALRARLFADQEMSTNAHEGETSNHERKES